MKEKMIIAHMKVAFEYAKLSTCNRLKVGCIIVKNDSVISIGYNGTPPGWDNCCEDDQGITKPEVLHAEANAIAKLAKGQGDGKNASVFITHAPCIECAKQLASIGVKEVFYSIDYRNTKGIEFLQKCNIPNKKIEIGEN
jgi:dCMP deaminase